MGVVVREANLPSENAVIVDVLARGLTPLSDDRRCEWLYMKGPHGVARAWIATDEERGSVIGVAGAFPRLVWVDNKRILAWVLGDFCLASAYRSLGPALQLQRSCLSVLEGREDTLCYDFPSASMVAVYKRMGFGTTGKMLRLAKPLRVDRKVKQLIKSVAAQRVVASVGNTLLKIGAPRADFDDSLAISIHAELCGEEFTVLAQRQHSKVGFCLDRSAEYLNWRYLKNPRARHEIVVARRSGKMVGYGVWTQAEEDGSIVDLFGEQEPGIVRLLVGEIAALAGYRGLMTLSVSINECHPWLSLFCEMGFRLRDSVPVMIIPSKTLLYRMDPKLTGWYLMQGDRDS